MTGSEAVAAQRPFGIRSRGTDDGEDFLQLICGPFCQVAGESGPGNSGCRDRFRVRPGGSASGRVVVGDGAVRLRGLVTAGRLFDDLCVGPCRPGTVRCQCQQGIAAEDEMDDLAHRRRHLRPATASRQAFHSGSRK